jgi:precorrin-4/cobalt-precorrin-4 C11-methyltransferase
MELSQTKSTLKPAVYIIGAGPGDPDLLTIKAYKILAQADIIFYANSLVPKQILQDVKPDAKLIPTGNKTLEDIIPLMIESVRNNLIVVRLHSGDLTLYSAINEQMQRLKEAKIPFELIPGISAFQDAAAKLCTELTIPHLVQTIILTRINGEASSVPDRENLASLAQHQASLCLYLSARHIDQAQEELLLHYPPDTPVAICYRLGWEDEKICLVSLTEMAKTTYENNLIRTTLYLISPALNSLNDQYNLRRSQLYNPNYSHLFRQEKSLT